MISRKSALLIYRFYEELFTEEVGFAEPHLHTDAFWDLVYTHDYETWFLDLVKVATDPRKLKQLMLELHTGRIIPKSKAVTIHGCQTAGREILKNLAVLALTITADMGHERETIGEIGQELKAQLELDGYIYKDKKLYLSESSVIDEPAEQSYLENLIDGLSLADANTIKHHLNRSEEHFIGGKWDDSIANSRKVLDAILNQVASAVYLKVNSAPIPPPMLKNATDIRAFLERQNIVTRVEREALDKNYGALSATGGHPYIAEKDQARLMRHLALTFSQFVLLRYQGFLANHP
jgi:hypothetical protein